MAEPTKQPTQDSGIVPPAHGEAREQLMLKSADAFRHVSELILSEIGSGRAHLGFAYGVNGAFAVELYLKCLLTVEGSPVPASHNLKFLFDQLSRESKVKIRSVHNERASQDSVFASLERSGIKTDLDSLLEQGQDVFEQFRYIYEGIPRGKSQIGFALNIFAGCVRDRILDLRLTWLGSGGPTANFPV
jgi:hypothetical protein